MGLGKLSGQSQSEWVLCTLPQTCLSLYAEPYCGSVYWPRKMLSEEEASQKFG